MSVMLSQPRPCSWPCCYFPSSTEAKRSSELEGGSRLQGPFFACLHVTACRGSGLFEGELPCADDVGHRLVRGRRQPQLGSFQPCVVSTVYLKQLTSSTFRPRNGMAPLITSATEGWNQAL